MFCSQDPILHHPLHLAATSAESPYPGRVPQPSSAILHPDTHEEHRPSGVCLTVSLRSDPGPALLSVTGHSGHEQKQRPVRNLLNNLGERVRRTSHSTCPPEASPITSRSSPGSSQKINAKVQMQGRREFSTHIAAITLFTWVFFLSSILQDP